MASKFKDTPSEKLDVCLKKHFSPDVVNEFFACLVAIYGVKEWSDLYVRKAEGRDLNVKLVYAYSDTLHLEETKDLTEFIFAPRIKESA